MNNIKVNYQMMFTTYLDLVNIKQLKEMIAIGITLAYRLVKENNIDLLKLVENIKYKKEMVLHII